MVKVVEGGKICYRKREERRKDRWREKSGGRGKLLKVVTWKEETNKRVTRVLFLVDEFFISSKYKTECLLRLLIHSEIEIVFSS